MTHLPDGTPPPDGDLPKHFRDQLPPFVLTCVMIFYNGVRYIDEAIRSVVDQSDQRVVILLVDDGSTDGSTDIAKDWQRRESERVRYLCHSGHANRGMSASRNLGVRNATTEFVAFLDCDDVWLPGAVEHVLSTFTRHPEADAVIGTTWWWRSWTGEADDRFLDKWRPLVSGLARGVPLEPPALFEAVFGSSERLVPSICSVFIRRSALASASLMEDRFRTMFEDQVLYAKVGLLCRTVLDDRPLSLYRHHPGSTTAMTTSGAVEAARQTFDNWLNGYVRELVAEGRAPRSIVKVVGQPARRDSSTDPVRQRPRQLLVSAWRRLAPPRVQRTFRRARGTELPENQPVHELMRAAHVSGSHAIRQLWANRFLQWNSHLVLGKTVVVELDCHSKRTPEVMESLLPHASQITVSHGFPARSMVGADWLVVFAYEQGQLTREMLPAVIAKLSQPGSGGILFLPGADSPAPGQTGPTAPPDMVASLQSSSVGPRVRVETFGSTSTREVVRSRSSILDLPGAAIDLHDSTEVMHVVIVQP